LGSSVALRIPSRKNRALSPSYLFRDEAITEDMFLKERWKGVMERGKEVIQKGQTLLEEESYFLTP